MPATIGRGSPAWIRALLSQPWAGPLVRLALVSAYLIGGIDKAARFMALNSFFEHPGLTAALVLATMLDDAQID